MNGVVLPPEAKGEWVWQADSLRPTDGYLFLRREFSLTEVPNAAEFWLCSRSAYHLYINARPFSRGPGPALAHTGYVAYHDVTYCLQIGTNVLCIAAHCASVSRLSDTRKVPGLWCQLNLDGIPALWTDEQWKVLVPACYLGNQPRLGPAGEFVEAVDLNRYPAARNGAGYVSWLEVGFDDREWQPATPVPDSLAADTEMQPSPALDVASDSYGYFNLVIRGEATQTKANTHVCFGQVFAAAAGVYAAETFVQVPEDLRDIFFQLYADDPYYFFVNDRLVKSQAARRHVDWLDPDWLRPRCFQQDELVAVDGTLSLNAGWNRILVVQQVEAGSAGITLVFTKTEQKALKFLRGDSAFSLPGWNLMGPLRIPFSCIAEPLITDELAKSSYFGFPPCDVAALLHAYHFVPTEETEMPVETVELSQGEYAILELEKYTRGCPEFRVTGNSGDQLDVVAGDFLTGHSVDAVDQGCRRLWTLTLAGREMDWRAFAPQGMKYLMFFARKAEGSISIREIAVRRQLYTFRETASFSCAEELFNQMWEAGLNTLESTYDQVFYNTGGPLAGQFLADAMIQSLGSFFAFGTYDASEKALREFADAQLENGEIPAVVPSDLHVRLHDFAMLWPMWLERHILHCGNEKLLKEMVPHLERLLLYFESLPCADGVLLGRPEKDFALPCLIDYDDTIDRRGISTGLNALYCHALLKSKWLFEAAGNAPAAKVCHDRATEIAKALRRLAWNEEKGLYADGYYGGQQSEHYSLQTNVLALYSGMVREVDCEDLLSRLFIDYAPFHSIPVDVEHESPYFKFFLLDMAFSMNRRDWAAEYLRYYWGSMLARGRGEKTWWKRFTPVEGFGPEKARGVCHGYGVTPSYFLITEVAGLRPAMPGYHQVYLNPLLTAVEWVKVQVPTPRGMIRLEWGFQESGELEMMIEAKFPLEVAPLLDRTVAAKAVIHVSDEVSILDTSSHKA